MNLLKYPRRPSGEWSIIDPDGHEQRGATLSCVHCGALWHVQPGSGRERGFCLSCMGPTCGTRFCAEHCLPLEKRFEIIEKRERLRATVSGNFGI